MIIFKIFDIISEYSNLFNFSRTQMLNTHLNVKECISLICDKYLISQEELDKHIK